MIERANHVWATDITYIPMACGWVYLCAIVDWASRRVLAHRVSISMDTAFCLEALDEALSKYGQPEIVGKRRRKSLSLLNFLPWEPAHKIVGAVAHSGVGTNR